MKTLYKTLSFAQMMVRSQWRHDARERPSADGAGHAPSAGGGAAGRADRAPGSVTRPRHHVLAGRTPSLDLA